MLCNVLCPGYRDGSGHLPGPHHPPHRPLPLLHDPVLVHCAGTRSDSCAGEAGRRSPCSAGATCTPAPRATTGSRCNLALLTRPAATPTPCCPPPPSGRCWASRASPRAPATATTGSGGSGWRRVEGRPTSGRAATHSGSGLTSLGILQFCCLLLLVVAMLTALDSLGGMQAGQPATAVEIFDPRRPRTGWRAGTAVVSQ